uniref:Spire type actin nucleation factor 2 n=1 Tax=Stegastes partitus TaxID=144197 RepID=A0A3B4ZWW5_9TELE
FLKAGSGGAAAPTDRGEPRDLAEPRELSLEEVLKSYEQPINEEQAWAVCYQCCSGLRLPRPPAPRVRRVKEPSSILLHRDGTVSLRPEPQHDGRTAVPSNFPPNTTLVQSLGVAIYRALDWGLDDSEERELGPQLERLIERMAGGDQSDGGAANGATDEGYSGQEEEEEEEQEEVVRPVCSFHQVMALCASRLADPGRAPDHYQAVCRALYVETLELQTFLTKIRDAKEMLKKISSEETLEDKSSAELDALKHRDWARLWVQLMKELRQGVKLKKVQEQNFNPLPTEFSLTPFEMLMQDIRARNYQLRKVMVDGDIPTRVKRNAHELILDFIRSRPPLKPVSERSLPPPPPQHQSLHDRVLAEIKQERKLRPVDPPSTCPCNVKSTSCIDLSVADLRPPARPRILLKAPTLAEMEEMNISESSPTPLKRDRSFSEHDLAMLRGDMLPSLSEATQLGGTVRLRGERPRSRTLTGTGPPPHYRGDEEFSHPVESLALTVDEVINVRRVLVKAEMEKFLQSKELYNNLKKGKVCCCCRVKFPLFSWPSTCLLCKRYRRTLIWFCCLAVSDGLVLVPPAAGLQMKIPSKKMAHIPVYTVGFHSTPKSHGHKSQVYKSLRSLSRRSVEEEFPHLYAHGCTLRDICAECTKFVADVISSSRRSLDILNNTPKREARPSKRTQSFSDCCWRSADGSKLSSEPCPVRS